MKDRKSEKKGNSSLHIGKKKALLFKVLAVVLVFTFFMILEVALRFSGYGTDYPLFVSDEMEATWVKMNPEIAKKYFGNSGNATVGFQELFKEDKDSETFRIFVLGASTAVGYPYRKNGSFHRWLQFALNTSYPNQKIEIINLALTAVNSYTLLDFTKQLIDYEPDALLIYAGHNEYYGALGVGRSNTLVQNPRWVNIGIQLKQLRLIQLAESIVDNIAHTTAGKKKDRATLMEKMAEDRKIVYESKKYKKGIYQFNYNFERIAQLTQKAGIPVFLSSLVSNEKGLKPFIGNGTNEETSANHYFELADEAYQKGNVKETKKNYILAKEYDQLRFRAPEAINDKIEELSLRFSHIYFVDTQCRFESVSDNGIIGNALLWEHVHPKLEGYSLVAHSFYEEILASRLVDSKYRYALSWSDLKQQMPITEVDEIAGKYEMLQLKEGWPFYEPIPKINKDTLDMLEQLGGKLATNLISWDDAMQTLYRHYQNLGDMESALKVAEGLTLEYPYEARFYVETALLSLRLRKMDKVQYHFKKAFELDPSEENIRRITLTLVEAEAFEFSLPYLEYAMEKLPDNRMFSQIYGAVKTILNKDQQDGVSLAESYLLLRKRAKAIEILNTTLDKDPNNEKALQLLNTIN
ncbi:hypothetical protein [Flagellimonas meridianipacifica]|uniref:GDSL-like lipase/acylhydrolase family protein n=1 Tax=Flagellimonas meridianipacifica TaxID=1080225 RepID=A0A2T0M8F1_9FLAO|nr:hypothetical protein [Allomuricauda pacifica]PRX53817.1 hypothetical protein CLV81_2205 [Allomuricauda pacifica]